MSELDSYIENLLNEVKKLEDLALEVHGYTPAMRQKLVIDIQTLEEEEDKLRVELSMGLERRFVRGAEGDVEQLRGYMQAQLECNGGVAWHIEDDIKYTKSAINIISEAMKVFG